MEQVTEYKLCKRGHVRSPDNVNKSNNCIRCSKDRQKTPEYKTKEKLHKADPEIQKRNRAKEKIYKNTERYKAYDREYKKSETYREYRLSLIKNLSDKYVMDKLKLQVGCAPPELIELKRQQLKLTRFARSAQKLKED